MRENKNKSKLPFDAGIRIEVAGRRIFVKMPKRETDVQFVRSFRFAYWDAVGAETAKIKANENELLIIQTSAGRLRLILPYNTEFSRSIREIPYCRWDAKNRWWTVPYSDKIITRLKEIALALGLEFHLEQEEQGIKGKPRVSPFDVPNYRPCPEIYVLKLRELRYSEHTIQSYTSLFEEFINYYHRFDIDRIDEAMITAFLRFLVIERKVSISYQNQPGQRQERPLHLVGRQNIRSFAPILSLV